MQPVCSIPGVAWKVRWQMMIRKMFVTRSGHVGDEAWSMGTFNDGHACHGNLPDGAHRNLGQIRYFVSERST